MLLYLFLSLFIFTTNSIAASADDTCIKMNQYTHYSTIQSAVKTLLINARYYGLSFNELIIFESFNYPNKKDFVLNYKKLETLIRSEEFNSCKSIHEEAALIIQYCIDDMREPSPEKKDSSPLESLPERSKGVLYPKISDQMHAVLLKKIGDRTPSPTKKAPSGLHGSSYWSTT